MKYLNFLPAVALLGLFSCNSGEEKTSDNAMSTDSTANKTTTESAVTTTPQSVMLVRHKVADFAKWLVAYEGHDSARLANGIHSYVIGRGTDDSNMVLIAMKLDDVEKARAFSKDPNLKSVMQKAGVVGAPNIQLVTMEYQDTAANMATLRSLTDFMVKDWTAWKTAFESNRQIRTDNGLTDRAYGHDVDNDKKVVLVVAINDTAKANAYWNGDLIKQKRKESGVEGEVKRFVYTVYKKY